VTEIRFQPGAVSEGHPITIPAYAADIGKITHAYLEATAGVACVLTVTATTATLVDTRTITLDEGVSVNQDLVLDYIEAGSVPMQPTGAYAGIGS
jgi:hypothetical protein